MQRDVVARVLVVARDWYEANETRKVLTAPGTFEVLTAANAERALQFLRTQRIDALIVDQALPDRPGVDLVRQAVEGGFEGAMILTAAQIDRATAGQALRLGVSSCVVKSPTWLASLLDLLVRALERARLVQRARALQRQNDELQGQLEALERQRDQLDRRDRVTGLYCEWYFEECRARELARANRIGHPLSLAELHVEGFDQLQAAHGGDRLEAWLRLAGQEIGRALRSTDVVAHDGSGHFRALLLDCDESNAGRVAARLQRTVGSLKQNRGLPAAFQLTIDVQIAKLGGGDSGD